MSIKPQTRHFMRTLHTKKEFPQVPLYPVLKAKELLIADNRRRHFLSKIHGYTGLDQIALYQVLYETALSCFAELIQAMPYQFGSVPGGLLDYSLEHAVIGLKHYHETAGKAFSPQYAYALFTAFLFEKADKAFNQQATMICDEEGAFVADWQPFEGNMIEKGNYYKLRRLSDSYSLSKSVVPLMVRQCMPEPGFNWIAQDSQLFSMWLAYLMGEKDKAGSIAQKAELTHNLIAELAKKERLAALKVNVTYPVQTKLGEDFAQWLNQGLEAGRIPVNTEDAYIYVSEDNELFLEERIFADFCSKYSANTNWAMLAKQFSKLGFTNKSISETLTLDQVRVNSKENVLKNQNNFFNVGAQQHLARMLKGLIVKRPHLFLNKSPSVCATLSFATLSDKEISEMWQEILLSLSHSASDWAKKHTSPNLFVSGPYTNSF